MKNLEDNPGQQNNADKDLLIMLQLKIKNPIQINGILNKFNCFSHYIKDMVPNGLLLLIISSISKIIIYVGLKILLKINSTALWESLLESLTNFWNKEKINIGSRSNMSLSLELWTFMIHFPKCLSFINNGVTKLGRKYYIKLIRAYFLKI